VEASQTEGHNDCLEVRDNIKILFHDTVELQGPKYATVRSTWEA